MKFMYGDQCHTAWKVFVFGVILVCIFPHSDWIRRGKEYRECECVRDVNKNQMSKMNLINIYKYFVFSQTNNAIFYFHFRDMLRATLCSGVNSLWSLVQILWEVTGNRQNKTHHGASFSRSTLEWKLRITTKINKCVEWMSCSKRDGTKKFLNIMCSCKLRYINFFVRKSADNKRHMNVSYFTLTFIIFNYISSLFVYFHPFV